MYYRQPKYFGEFKCVGSECLATCCFGWRIVWTKDEIDKVKNAPGCSDELKEVIENTFVSESEDIFKVKLGEKEKCPCQTEDGLCMIHKELGEEYLSKTCTIYPRSYASYYTHSVYRICHLSCPEIVRKLVNDEKAADIVNVPSKESFINIPYQNFITKDDVLARPELEYCGQIVEFFYELIGDKKCGVETSLVLGALAAHNLTALIGNKEYSRIPEALRTFRKDAHNAAGLKAIESIKPNYNVCLGVADKIIEGTTSFRIADVFKDENGVPTVSRYLAGEEKLKEMMKDKPFWLRNIALNILLELGIPFKSKEHTVYENYCFFVAAVSCIKLIAAAAAFIPEKSIFDLSGQELRFEGLEKVYGTVGIVSRDMFQNKNTFDKVTTVLNKFELNTPMHLALLIK